MSRRDALRTVGLLTVSSLLAACGQAAPTTAPPPTSAPPTTAAKPTAPAATTAPAPTTAAAAPTSAAAPTTAPATSAAGPVTFWVISPFTSTPDAPIFKAADQYKQSHNGATVTIESFPPADFRDKFITAIKAGQGPDVASVDSAWMSGLAASDVLLAIDQQFAPIKDQFFPGPTQTGAYLGKQYAVPWYTNNVGLFWNKKLFQAAGLSAAPATWQELVDFGKKLTSGDKYGLMLGSKGFGSYLWFPFAWQNGATLISADGKTAEFESPQGQEAWQFYADLYLTQKIVPEDIKSATNSWDQLFAPFIQERVAMMMTGDFGIKPVQTGNPNLEFGIAPLPRGKEAATVIGGYDLAIAKTSKAPDAAWEFIRWLTAQEQEGILEQYARIPARQTVLGTAYAKQDPLIQVFIDQSPAGRARATVPQWDEIENTILADAWDSVVLGQAAPADALSAAAQKTNELLQS